MRKKFFLDGFFLVFSSVYLFSLDVIEVANKDYLTLEETIELAEKDEKKYTQMISDFKFLKNATEGHIQADFKEIDSVINKYPYMPCTEAVRFLLLPDNEVLNSANYIYSVFAGCPADNTMKDKIYLRILEASLKENNFHWSYNAARDLSDKAKETIVYKSFMTAISQN